jgi:hypothetical protein
VLSRRHRALAANIILPLVAQRYDMRSSR